MVIKTKTVHMVLKGNVNIFTGIPVSFPLHTPQRHPVFPFLFLALLMVIPQQKTTINSIGTNISTFKPMNQT